MEKKVLSNSFWMMSEKIISIVGLIFVTSYVAKYVGPSIFGKIAFATSLFQITQIIAQLGSDVIIFKRISKNINSGIRLINATTRIRVIVYVITSIPVIALTFKSGDIEGLIFVIACFIACFFTSLDVYSIYYNATLQSKKNTIINAFGLIIALVLRWLIAVIEMDPLYLCIPIILSGLIPYAIRKFYFDKHLGRKIGEVKKKHSAFYTKYLISAGMAFVLSTISVAIYIRLSLLSLGYLEGSVQVGIYSVAATLASSWAFVCQSFITSSLPSIFSEKVINEAIKKAARLGRVVIAISLPMVLAIYIAGGWFIDVFYGNGYTTAFLPMIILSFSTMVSSLGTISARVIAKYSGYAFLSKKMLSVAVISLILNVIMIQYWGILGASFATLATEILSLTLLNYFFQRGLIFKVHAKMLSPSLLK